MIISDTTLNIIAVIIIAGMFAVILFYRPKPRNR